MSQSQNEQLVRDAYAAFVRGDIDGVLARVSDDVVWDCAGAPELPYGGVRHGKTGVAEFFRILADTENVQTFEPQEFISDRDTVIVLGRYAAVVKATGRTAQAEWVHVFRIRDGKVAGWREYLDTAAYLQAYRVAATV